jgi:hypothetical protein
VILRAKRAAVGAEGRRAAFQAAERPAAEVGSSPRLARAGTDQAYKIEIGLRTAPETPGTSENTIFSGRRVKRGKRREDYTERIITRTGTKRAGREGHVGTRRLPGGDVDAEA